MLRIAFTPEEAADVGQVLGIDWDDVVFTPEDLAAGMDVELEHGTKLDERVNVTDDDVAATAQIAWAHLMEDPDYYVMLDAMEQEFDGERTPELRDVIAMPHYRDDVVLTDDHGYEETYDTARAAAHGALEWFMMFYNDLEADLTDAGRDDVQNIINSFAVREIHTVPELASEFRSLKRRITKALGPAWDLVYAPWIRVQSDTTAHWTAATNREGNVQKHATQYLGVELEVNDRLHGIQKDLQALIDFIGGLRNSQHSHREILNLERALDEFDRNVNTRSLVNYLVELIQ